VKHPPDAAHPITERFAAELYARTPWSDVPEFAGRVRQGPWEREAPEVREVFRARARLLLAGDMSVLPMERGMGPT